VRNPVGNQPKDIYQQIVALIKKCIQLNLYSLFFFFLFFFCFFFDYYEFIVPEESVILCVIPANNDFATSEAIALSRQV
jgi:ACR3 family arsenite efflux pump ArsB